MKKRKNPKDPILILADTWDLLEEARTRTSGISYWKDIDKLRDDIDLLKTACHRAQTEIREAARLIKEGR